MKILLVDDKLTERMAIASCLKKLGHDVACGENGREAVEMYSEQKPDLVIMDIAIPIMNGHDAARRIRASDHNDWVPIIFLGTGPGDINAAAAAAGDDYMMKPVNDELLTAKMAAMQRIAALRHRFIALSCELKSASGEVAQLKETDDLTGIANRRYLEQHLEQESVRCARYNQPLSLIMADLDHFKVYNDHYGHQAADSCLKKVAHTLRGALKRPADLVGRYDGQVFCMVLPDTPVEGASHLAEKLRGVIEQLAIPNEKSTTAAHITISLGIASGMPEPGASMQWLLSDADRALYEAKQMGRNRVVLSEY